MPVVVLSDINRYPIKTSSMKSKCPKCGGELTVVKRFCLCPECGFSCEIEQQAKEKLYSSRYVFISYGHDSYAPLASRLKDDLKKRGHRVWTDLELKAGDDWEQKIEGALDDTISHKPNGCFLLLMSPYSVRRPDGYCLNELAKAVKSGVFTIPVKVVSEVEPPLSIARIQFLDMSECYMPDFCEAVYERQLELLIKAIEHDSIDFDGMQARLQHLLRPIEFKSEISKHMKMFTGRQWVLDQIRGWLDDSNGSKVFWLTGGPGVGKTAISIWLSCKVLPEIHAWHLCQHSDSITSNPKNCILSLAYYLSTHLPDYFRQLKHINLEEIININEVNVNTLFMRLLVEPLNSIVPPDSPVVILIDAIDEANTEHGDNPLAKFIGMNFSKFPSWIRFIITSRPVHDVKKWLKQLRPVTLETSDTRNLQDIRQYVVARLRKASFTDTQLDAIVESIVDKSEGVFLYAEFICESIEAGEIDPYEPEEFPSGLYNVYEDYFQRRFPSPDQYNEEVVPLLKLIVAAREPLHLNDIIPYLVHLNKDWDEDFLTRIMKQLGSLFRLDNNVIVPFHKSICDWLTRNDDSTYYISRKKGHRSMIAWGKFYGQDYSSMPEYHLKHLGYHMLHANCLEDAVLILKDQKFMDEQIARLNYDAALSIYFVNLREAYLKQTIDMRDIYNSSFFYRLLDYNRRYFLDNGYFLDLSQIGFQNMVDMLQSRDSFDDFSYIGVLYYLYALEKFESVISLTERIMLSEELFASMPDITKSQMYEVYGLSLRKLGQFENARNAFEATSKYGEMAGDPYQISLGYANLAKIFYHQLNFDSGYQYNDKAFEFLSRSLDMDNPMHGSKTGIRLFMAEYKRLAAECYIWGQEYDKAYECFAYIENVYSEIQIRDRYYVRYLYSLALYFICTHNAVRAAELLGQAELLCRNNYDRATVLYYESLIKFVSDNPLDGCCPHSRIARSIELFEGINSNIELTEVRILASLMSGNNMSIIEYDPSNSAWFEYVFEFFKHLKETKYESKGAWKWRMDTDSEQKYLYVSVGKK